MDTRLGLVFLLIGTLRCRFLVQAQNQEGFISLACGLPKSENITDEDTTISYISDEDYIDVGVPISLSLDDEYFENQETSNLRIFPDGLRNCYTLNLKKGDKYLIAAIFWYGNYDNKSENPSFDLYIGPNRWTTVDLSLSVTPKRLELVHVLTSNRLQICLVRTGTSIPFMSALELRPLSSNIYNTQSGSLMMGFSSIERIYMSNGTSLLSSGRFPDDIHDRDWTPLYFFGQDWRLINTSRNIDTDSEYNLPEPIMKYAATSVNDSVEFEYSWLYSYSTTKYQAFLHFADFETLNASESREFNITFNGKYLFGPYSPPKLKADTVPIPGTLTSQEFDFKIGFVKTKSSTHPPILNAIELYEVLELPQLETDEIDVDAMMNIKAMYGLNITSWQGDPCAPQEFLWAGLNCSYEESNSPRITVLKLSSSGLKGQIAPYIVNLTKLAELDLSNNNLTGEIPEFLADMKSLLVINLSGNQFSGSIPEALLQRQKDRSLELTVDEISNPSNHKKSLVVPLVASVASLAVIIVALAAIFIIQRRRKKHLNSAAAQHSQAVPSTGDGDKDPYQRAPITKDPWVSFSDVLTITNNFERVLGRGGFGIVYHGYLNDTQVAVKMLSQSSVQGYKQFKAEVELLLRVHHRNLVSLVGYCNEGDKEALIYEYMASGDLRKGLSGDCGGKVLNWADRLRIATETAQGLEYLHNGCKPQIIHRDIKTTNILLNEHFQAKLSDFGLSRTFPAGGESHVSTVVAGTPGYLDPEYYQSNRLTEKSDVFSFGVVLLEIITNSAVIDRTRERPHIIEWVGFMLSRCDINSIVDEKLHGDCDPNSVWKLVELAMACVNPSSEKRPTMNHVVMELNECLKLELKRTQLDDKPDLLCQVCLMSENKVPHLIVNGRIQQNSFDAMMNIKATYGLNITSWQGDPCLPLNVRWSGLNCSYKESDPPRITALMLPSSGLKGKIAPSIAYLTELTELDLSYNNLTGKIPEFLADLKSLSIINLSWNQFSGSVPEALLKKQRDGSLNLTVDGNSSLRKAKTSIVVLVVATVAAIVVLVAAVAAFRIIQKKKPYLRNKQTYHLS